jgi:hypothetical protein
MKIISLLAMLLSTSALANLNMAPPTLNLERNSKGVFVDFTKSISKITYDINNRKVYAKTVIKFNQALAGKPIFDLIETPTKILINSQESSTKTTSMDGVSTVRYIDKVLPIGEHTLEVHNEINKNLSWSSDYVRSAFWMSDLSDRKYLEQYLPTNLEYDQYQNNIEVKVLNSQIEHVIYTNGQAEEISKNHWKITYPETYTASSLYFHMSKAGLKDEVKRVYKSVDGRDIPVVVYTSYSANKYMTRALEILAELEADYGPWPHAQVIIYGAGSGGMEYCGATITSMSALGHELIHSYFARGIMPAHGNSGWVDEAIASWRDANYRTYSKRHLSRTIMASHSTYKRTTDRNAYTKGMKFIGFLHGKLSPGKDSFKVFLKSFFEERKFKPFKTYEFKDAIEKFYNTSLTEDFDNYIYGKNGIDKDNVKNRENIYHPHLSAKQLKDLL